MNTARELDAAQPTTHVGTNRTHPRERTGVRLVLTNAADPSRADDYSAWYDDYEHAIIRPGLLANAFRFENPNAAGTPTDPRYAAIYDIVSPGSGIGLARDRELAQLSEVPVRRSAKPPCRASVPRLLRADWFAGN
jgi:hypothetical protein